MRGIMNQDQFLLKWNNHQNNFVEVFNYLRTQDAFVDVTLACDGKSFSAHKVVLSACSPYFQGLFQTNPCKHPIVFLKDVKGQDMEALIEFIYKGEVSVSQSELGSLISTAENLKIKGLAEPERPNDKGIKRLASPPRVSTLQHTPIAFLHTPSPNAKRKRTVVNDPYSSHNISHTLYSSSRFLDKEEKISPLAATNDIIHNQHLTQHSQVVFMPPQTSQQDTGCISSPDLPHAYSHHSAVSNEGLLCSVSGPIYVGSPHSSSTHSSREPRENFLNSDAYQNNVDHNEPTSGPGPGPSGLQNSHLKYESKDSLTIKLEPTVTSAGDCWDHNNQSPEDGAVSDGGISTPTGVVGSSSDPHHLLPLHTEISDGPSIHDSTVEAARAILRVMSAATSKDSLVNDAINKLSMPGKCKICGETIARGEHRNHMASHTGHRPLHCVICGRGFHQTEDLKRHIRVHTGEKPYRCSTCGVSFRQRGHLSRHVFKYHPGDDSEQSKEKL